MAHPSVTKAPALAKRLINELQGLGYEYNEAVAMLDEEGTRSIREFIDAEKAEAAGYQRKPELDLATSTCYIKTDSQGNTTNVKQIFNKKETDEMLHITVDSKGKTENIKTVDTGAGIQSAKPLPKVEPTKVEPTASVQTQSQPTAQQPQAERMYDYNKLPVELQRLIDDIKLHRMPTTQALPVLHIVGWNQDTKEFIFKCTQGQAALNAYGWLHLTEPKFWQNLPMLVVAPTDLELLKIWNGCYPDNNQPAQADFKLMCPSVLKHLTTIDYSQFAIVVPAPASTKEQASKVKRAAAKPEQEPTPTPTPEKKAPAITDATLSELATATNHMKKVSLVNQILVALGEPKVSSKCKKDELAPVVSRLLAQFNVPVAEPKSTSTIATTKAKTTKEPTSPAPTKAAIEKWYVSSGKGTKKEFAALAYNWRSSIDRQQAASDLGYVV